MGVLPEYRTKGVPASLFADLIPRYQKFGLKYGESQVEMETNESMQSHGSTSRQYSINEEDVTRRISDKRYKNRLGIPHKQTYE